MSNKILSATSLAGVLVVALCTVPSHAAEKKNVPASAADHVPAAPAGAKQPAVHHDPPPAPANLELLDLKVLKSGTTCTSVEMTIKNKGGRLPISAYTGIEPGYSVPGIPVSFKVTVKTAGGQHEVGAKTLLQIDPDHTLRDTSLNTPIPLAIPLNPGDAVQPKKPMDYTVKALPGSTPENDSTNNQVTRTLVCP